MSDEKDQNGHEDMTILAGRKAVEPPPPPPVEPEPLVEPEELVEAVQPEEEQPDAGMESYGHEDATVLASSFADRLNLLEPVEAPASETSVQEPQLVESSMPEEAAEEHPVFMPESSEPVSSETPPLTEPPDEGIASKPPKNNKTIIIIAIVAAVLILCCCVALIVGLIATGVTAEILGASLNTMDRISLLKG